MTQSRSARAAIRLRGVRHNNLKNFDLDVPLGKLTVITGLSGSGKSSLAFDTLFAEGQRRYIETFSPYARQFFDRMDKPQVDRIEGIPPAIAIEQRNSVRSTRSTVGTMTELCDYLKVLWPHLAHLHCRQCGQPVRREPPQEVWGRVKTNAECGMRNAESSEVIITFDVPLSVKLSLEESLELIARQGYQRILLGSEIVRIAEARQDSAFAIPPSAITVVQDRLKLTATNRARFVEACEQAYHFGKGRLTTYQLGADSKPEIQNPKRFSAGFHCATCDLDYREPSPALFSFNHPVGACATCKGFGRIISIDYALAIPDRTKPLAGGAVKPWQSGMSAECQVDLAKFCRANRIPMDVPFHQLPQPTQDWVINGDANYDTNDPENSWPRKWYGVKGYFRWLESKSYKMHVRVLLSRYRAYTTCADCQGQRLKPEALLYKLSAPRSVISKSVISEPVTSIQHPVSVSMTGPLNTDYSLADFYALSVEQALALIESFGAKNAKANDPITLALTEVRVRLRYLVEVGLGYLTLDRPTRTLSGGETERVNLTTCLGTRLVNTLFVLDEPSVGLHPRDTVRLVRILQQLRDLGNTIVVVEHESSVMRAADLIVDLGPGQGENGGHIVFCGPVEELLGSERSLTGAYLSGRKRIEIPLRRPVRHEASAALALNESIVPYQTKTEGRSKAPGSRIKHPASNTPIAPDPPNTAPLNTGSLITDSLITEPHLRLTHAARHNLQNLTVDIPLSRFVVISGVSGSGKTTLVREVLLPALQARLKNDGVAMAKASDRMDTDSPESEPADHGQAEGAISGWESLGQVVLVDQSPLGKTPRSNPVVYIGAFDDVRELFAQTDLARQRGLTGSAFSFNSGVGQCERCRGAGFEKIEMQFLSDVFVRCPECNGRRYRGHILEVKLRGTKVSKPVSSIQYPASITPTTGSLNTDSLMTEHWNIADLLEATVDDALEFLALHRHVPAGRRALARLKLLQEVGLGYLRLGQAINTLSGGESQRLKLVSHLAESAAASPMVSEAKKLQLANTSEQAEQWLAKRRWGSGHSGRSMMTPASTAEDVFTPGNPDGHAARMAAPPVAADKKTLFLFDEPTTGLHFDDVRVLLQVFQRLVDSGHSVVVIEHNLDVIKCADWVIDLGPEAGEHGGQLVAAGTPEEVAACTASHTGRFLREVLETRPATPSPPAPRRPGRWRTSSRGQTSRKG